jgi:hypothetical protein
MTNFVSYNHTQSVAATVWTIVHDLNTSLISIDTNIVYNGNSTVIIPSDVVIIDNNTVAVHFSMAYTGKARIVGSI